MKVWILNSSKSSVSMEPNLVKAEDFCLTKKKKIPHVENDLLYV